MKLFNRNKNSKKDVTQGKAAKVKIKPFEYHPKI